MPGRGAAAEQYAASWLRQRKLRILSTNFRCRCGEIDIIAMDESTLCIIEVRYRKSANFGSAAETVTMSKQQRIINSTQFYLQRHQQYSDLCIRFDVLAMSGSLEHPDIDWHKNAFMMSA